MNASTPIARSLAVLAILASGAAGRPAVAQHIEPQVPAATQQRGSLGHPFPGYVEDLEVIGPDRFVLAIRDRPQDSIEHVRVYTSTEGAVGRAFAPDEGRVYDVAAAHDGGFWVLYHSADEVTESRVQAGGMRLQRFSGDGEPVGEDLLLTGSLLSGPDAVDQPRRGRIIPFQSGAVAVAFTSFIPETRLHELRLVSFSPDGEEGLADILEDRLSHMPTIDASPLQDGGAAVAWGTGSPMWDNLKLTTLEPDGQWSDTAQSIWSSSSQRGHASNLRLAPITGSEDLAAIFSVGGDQVWQRFNQNGVAISGVEVLNSTGALIEPLRIEGGRLVGLADGHGSQPGLYTIAQGDAAPVPIEALNVRITAFGEESRDSIVVAAVTPSSPDAAPDAPTFAHLYRIRR